ncbi:hypothetical protein B0E48_10035 [Rhodanobacter sp. C03]|nr:hypothetical protein B0E48_10035 [Rhodanobacter sp. C03]
MKRHLNSLLQRKHTEFEGARDMHHASRFNVPPETAIISLKDGYDWLAMIKDAQASVRPH